MPHQRNTVCIRLDFHRVVASAHPSYFKSGRPGCGTWKRNTWKGRGPEWFRNVWLAPGTAADTRSTKLAPGSVLLLVADTHSTKLALGALSSAHSTSTTTAAGQYIHVLQLTASPPIITKLL
jgi:hypothetical protein